jgi:hypothetical protein
MAATLRSSDLEFQRQALRRFISHITVEKTDKKLVGVITFTLPGSDFYDYIVCPHRDSNPSFGLERATS